MGGFRVKNIYPNIKGVIPYFKELYLAVNAFHTMGEMRNSIEFCYSASRDYRKCFNSNELNKFNTPGSHFDYNWKFLGNNDYKVMATRNNLNNGNPENRLFITQKGNSIFRRGEGIYWFII